MQKSRFGNWQHVHWVIVCAITGFALTFRVLNNNYKEYAALPAQVTICAGNSGHCDTFRVKQKFVLPQNKLPAGIPNVDASGYVLFHYNPSFLIWTMLILLLITLCAGSFPVFINSIAEIKSCCAVSRKRMFFTIGFGLVVTLVMALMPAGLSGYYNPYKIAGDFGILFNNPFVIQGLIIASILLVLPVILTMFVVSAGGNAVVNSLKDEAAQKSAPDKFARLNASLLSALQVLAVVVVLTGFCSSALGRSIKSVFELTGFDIFPAEMSYAYGLFYAMFLALFYLPAFYSLKRNTQQAKEIILKNTGGLDKATLEERYQLSSQVEIKTNALEALKLALTILSPLLTTFIPESLHLFK